MLSSQIRTFVAIANAGSITSAASELGMSKATASEHLRQLEQQLGARLFVRTTRKQSLTPVGAQFLVRCRALLDLSATALEEVNEHSAQPGGSIRITVPDAFVDFALAPAITEIYEIHPRLISELIVSDERLNLVDEMIDLAITVGSLPNSNLKVKRIGSLREVFCVSPAFAASKKLTESDIKDPDVVRYFRYIANKWEGQNIQYTLPSNSTSENVVLDFKPHTVASSLSAVAALVRIGAGMALLPEFHVAQDLREGKLIRILPNYETHQVAVNAVHPYGNMVPKGVRTMIDIIEKKMDSAQTYDTDTTQLAVS